MVLWIILAGLTAIALAAVVWPFLRSENSAADDTGYDSAVFKDQIAEIESERERGLISEAEAEAARSEVARRLLAADRADATRATQQPRETRSVAALALVGAFVFVPVVSTALYLVYGSPGMPDHPLSARLDQRIEDQGVDELVARVEARLREFPQDGRGWEVIAPVYMRQRRYGDAADAFGKALRLQGETPRRLSDFGNALVLAHDGVVTEQARKVLQQALAMDPSLMRARFWLAVAQEQDGEIENAVQSWRDLLARSAPDTRWHGVVQERLAALGQETSADLGRPRESRPESESGETALRGPSREDVAAAQNMSTGDRSAMIRQMVSGLAERLNNEGGSVEEWKRLVRSQVVLGDRDAATSALEKARKAYAGKDDALAEFANLADTLDLK
jgi:cytochrome c-type biogenesis protein CcmH